MKKQLTRAELEAIGENWFQRRNRLLAAAHNKLMPYNYCIKAFRLASILNIRISKIAIALSKVTPKKQFPSGGVFSNTPPGEGEYVIKK